jgi:hypothetical protein
MTPDHFLSMEVFFLIKQAIFVIFKTYFFLDTF